MRSPRGEPVDDDWDSVVATVTLNSGRFSPDTLAGLDGSAHHLEVAHASNACIFPAATRQATLTGRGWGSLPSGKAPDPPRSVCRALPAVTGLFI